MEQGENRTVFDEIRHTREDGMEYWLYSELSQVLEYEDKSELDRIMEELKQQQDDMWGKSRRDIAPLEETVMPGEQDYVLSRRACRTLVERAPQNMTNSQAKMYFRMRQERTGVLWKILFGTLIAVPILCICVMFYVVNSAVREKRETDRENMRNSEIAMEALASGYSLIGYDYRVAKTETRDGVEYLVFGGHGYIGELGETHTASIWIRKDAPFRSSDDLDSGIKYDIYGRDVELLEEDAVLIEPYGFVKYQRGPSLAVTAYIVLPLILAISAGLWAVLFWWYRRACENSTVYFD
ncbi:MAG: hypothetical protein J6Y10_03165 [Lachnospiraceae bacterium]|nr:hypothetical protein [Lachnospiraceae bacterium]